MALILGLKKRFLIVEFFIGWQASYVAYNSKSQKSNTGSRGPAKKHVWQASTNPMYFDI
jgi:hypothetical protein